MTAAMDRLDPARHVGVRHRAAVLGRVDGAREPAFTRTPASRTSLAITRASATTALYKNLFGEQDVLPSFTTGIQLQVL